MSGNPSLDCSIDENDNQLHGAVPVCQSTPEKPSKKNPQAKYTCSVCGKAYQVNYYYLKHVESHQTQVSATDLNVSQTVHLDSSDISFSRLTPAQDLDITGTFRVPPTPGAAKKQPPKKASKPKPHLICTYCNKGYVCSRSYKIHVRTHIIQEAASRFPNTSEILQHSEGIGQKTLLLVSNGPCIGEAASEFRELLGYVISISSEEKFSRFSEAICTNLVISIGKVKCLLPSALVNSLMEDQENILSDPDLCDSFLKIIDVLDQFSDNVCAQFFLKFVLFFTTEILQYISQTFKSKHKFKATPRIISEPDKEDRQVIYYIAGSIIRGYVKIAKRFPKSRTWQEVVCALQSKVLVDKAEGDLIPDAEWTADVDRGALYYINTKCQELFVRICKVVFASEKSDGSIEYEAVITEVLNSDLSIEWDTLISDSLTETVSVELLSDILQCFCRTCGRGITRRRLNFIHQKPVASMTTRHLAASRKNRSTKNK